MLSDITEGQAKIIRKMGYYDLFDPVLLSCETGEKKPSPQAFNMMMQRLKLPSTFVLFIDDRKENVEAAQRMGIESIQFLNPEQLKRDLKEKGFNLP